MNSRTTIKTLFLIVILSTSLQAWTFESPLIPGSGIHRGDDSTAVLKGVTKIESEQLDSTRVTHGPVVYGVTDTSAVIFCRTNQASEITLEYSSDPGMIGSVTTRGFLTSSEYDYVAHIPITGLTPLTRYHYSFVINGVTIGQESEYSFWTFPQETDPVDHSFAVVSDASNDRFRPSFVYDDINMLNPNFMVVLGDFDHRDPGRMSDPADVEDWRRMYREKIHNSVAGGSFAEYIGNSIPVCWMWDDHDYGDNNSDMYAVWKPLATRAFREYHPNYPLANSDGGNWYRFRCAQSEIFVLDLRSQRDFYLDWDNEKKSMLDGNGISDGQKDWLLNGLRQSTATWKFILSTVPFNPTVVKFDSWYGYQTEQAEIVDFITANDIRNVIIVSADIHTGGAIDDGTNSYFPEVSVPHSNFRFLYPAPCAAFDCGTWSEGFHGGYDANGFALIRVSSDYVELMTWSRAGENQVFHTVWKQ